MPDPQPIIDIERLTKTYAGRETPSLNDVALSVPAGQRIALLGPNGAGKSTLLKILSLAIAPTSGRVMTLGADISAPMTDVQRRRYMAALGVVFQSPSLDPLLTVRENLETQALLVGAGDGVVTQIASRLGLSDRLNDRVKTLSGGLIRRADLARAVLHRPRLLLLDEPTTGLDPAARAAFLDLVEELSRDRGMTVLMSTHLIDEAARADRVIMMARGRIAADDAPLRLRSAMGAWLVRLATAPDAHLAATLASMGLTQQSSSPRVFASGADEPARLAHAAAALAGGGIAFEVGPPDLADAYLTATGEQLEPRAEPAHA